MPLAYIALLGFLIVAWAVGRIWEAETREREFRAHTDQMLTMIGDRQ
jgi:hypothetical protein